LKKRRKPGSLRIGVASVGFTNRGVADRAFAMPTRQQANSRVCIHIDDNTPGPPFTAGACVRTLCPFIHIDGPYLLNACV
jgi:hypothetical protein